MSKIAVKIDYIFNWNKGYTQILVLQTQDNQISFPIIIANFEAICLLKELEKLTVKRPQTHDLFFSFMQVCDIHLKEVYIHELRAGIFYTKLICIGDDKVIELDSRPSDAVILASKAKVPIFVHESLLKRFGMPKEEMEKKMLCFVDAPPDFVIGQEKHSLENIPNENLENLLEHAIGIEDFEMAAQIRDILKQRKS
ncbi:MAG: bifunctional nuclease family protein [Bacteroidales bacterium]|jgi:bifunctional DNase/RNase|nr:bifunctional nuclease family protein [Bacteroidales bacterium]